MKSLITCNRCNKVAFEVPRKGAESEVAAFNKYFNGLSKGQQREYYGGTGSNIEFYEGCHYCGNNYKDFRDAVDGDCPDGCTINPVISRRE